MNVLHSIFPVILTTNGYDPCIGIEFKWINSVLMCICTNLWMTDATYIKIVKVFIRPTPKQIGFGGKDRLYMDDSAPSHADLCLNQYLDHCDRTQSRVVGGGTCM